MSSRKPLSSDDSSNEDALRQRWAARLGLDPDSPYVVSTAEVERIRERLLESMARIENRINQTQDKWTDLISSNNLMVNQFAALLQLTQTNQLELTFNCGKLTTSLERFDRTLTTLIEKIEKSNSDSSISISGSTFSQSDLSAIVLLVKSLQSELNQSTIEIRPKNQPSPQLKAATVPSPKISKKAATSSVEGRIAAIACAALAGLLLIQSIWLGSKINHVNNNVNTALLRLQRLESRER